MFRYLRMHRYVRNTVLMVGVLLLVLPAALSDGHERGHGPKHPRAVVSYVFEGTYNVSGSSVSVRKGNRHVRRAGFVGQTVAFDLTEARIRVADVNADGKRDAADLHDGDIVAIKVRLPRSAPGTGPFAAHKVRARPHRRPHGQ